jgi:IS605 OrfB family transposase
MEVTLTAKLKLDLPLPVAAEFIRAYTDACNFASEIAFRSRRPSNRDDLNTAVYGPLRETYHLSAQVAQSASRAVAGKYAALKKLGHQPTEPVSFQGEPVQLQGGERARDFGFTKDGKVSLTTLQGRVKISYKGPPRLPLFLSEWSLGGARLHLKGQKMVERALASGCSVIALEDLTGIRERGMRGKKFRIQVNTWAFHQLQTYIEYKAKEAGLRVLYVDPAYTSQGCSRCGYTARSNRYGKHFRCGACGLRLHADLNGARNIRLRGILAQQALLEDGAPSVAP